MNKNRIGRNDPCICGSGKKYKKCCYLKNDKTDTSDNSPPIKISEAILKISEPLIIRYPLRRHITVLMDLAIASWNISLTTGKTKEEIKNKITKEISKKLDAEDLSLIEEQMEVFIKRKNRLYGEIRHFIIDYNLSFDDNGKITLDIKSAPFRE